MQRLSRSRWSVRTLGGSFAGTALLATCLGCGGDAPPTTAAPANTTTNAAPAVAPAQVAAAPAAAARAAPRSTATQWIGGIPYDVFYDRPLEVAADQTALNSAAPAPAVAANTAPPPAVEASAAPAMPAAEAPAAPASPGGGGAPDWAKVAPLEQITAEITSLRNELQQKLSTLATYNQNWEAIGVDATELAALAGVVESHPGDVSWKANAKVARTLAAAINSNAAKTGRSAYDATKAPFDNLVDLLSGNPPTGVEAEDQAPFADYADRSVLMSRLESTLNYLKANVNNQERLTENAEEAKRRLTVLSTLMAVVATPSYDHAGDADYQKFATTFVNAALSGRDAVDGKDFDTYNAGLATMQKTCNECHAKYAFGGDSF